jgi:carbonic anhydrase/acetyltransferase-like protein (isoleucine patch superfamily)
MNDKSSTQQKLRSPFATICAYGGRWPKIADSVFVADGARIVGDVTLGEQVSVWFNTVLRGDIYPIEVGALTNIQDGAIVHTTHNKFATKIGRNVTIGHLAMVHGCTIGDNCLIGMSATILDGATIGEGCIVGAGAVVKEGAVIPPRSLVVGVPAKVVRELTESDIEGLKAHAKNYIEYTRGFDFAGGTKPLA